MGGRAEGKFVRKRKRKSRSERDLLRQPLMEQKKHGEKTYQRKKDDMPPSTCCSLRSRDVSVPAPAPVPRSAKMSRNLTQGRLTRGLFSYAKSSNCISRGPIPETASVKKKVEEDLKRIVNPSPSTSFYGSSRDVGNKTDRVVTVSDSDKDDSAACRSKAVEDKIEAAQVAPVSTLPSASQTHKMSVQVQTSSPVSSTSHQTLLDSTKSKACPKSNKSTSSSTSLNSDGGLDEILPVNEISVKMLQSLKPKFKKLFPKRDLNMELNSSLQKLLQQSSRNVSIPNHSPVERATKEHTVKPATETNIMPIDQDTILSHPSTCCTTTLSLCQPFSSHVTSSPSFQSLSVVGGNVNRTGTVTETRFGLSSILTKSDTNSQKIGTEEPESKSIHFFLPNVLSGDAEMQNVPKFESFNRPNPHHQFFTSSSSSTTGRGRCKGDNPPTLSALGFVIPNAHGDTVETHNLDPPLIINIDGKDDDGSEDDDSGFALAKYNSFMASARCLKAKLEKQNKEKHLMSQELAHCYPPPRRGSLVHDTSSPINKYRHANKNVVKRFNFSDDSKIPNASVLSAFGFKNSTTTSGPISHHRQHNYYFRDRNPRTMSNYSSGNDTSTIPAPSNLTQSRRRLKTALDSIFMDSEHHKSSVIHNNKESMDWQDVDLLTDMFPHVDDDYHQRQHDFYRQSLDELRVHQSDMQHQARSFLDHLDQNMLGIGQNQIDHHPQPSSPSPFHQLSTASCPGTSWL